MRRQITRIIAVLAAGGGLAILLSGPAWAASGPQPASGIFRETSVTVDSTRVVKGNTILVITVSGIATGTVDGPFTETDTVVIKPDGSVTLAGIGTQSGTLGTCGTGSAPYVTEAQGTASARSGHLLAIGKVGSANLSFTVNAVTGEGTYVGTYRCT
jgi:hypothetical protein